jgi:hypothetical protein
VSVKPGEVQGAVMKRKLTMKTYAFILSILMLSILAKVSAYADIICVNPMDPSCYNTIQEGINASVSGDTVEVVSGTYIEQITIKGGVTVKGENRNTTIIWNNNDTVQAGGNSSIQGFTITSASGSAIKSGQSSPTIQNNIIKDSGSNGVFIYAADYTHYPKIMNNIIKNNGRGIYFYCQPFWIGTPYIYGDIWNNIIINNTEEGILLSKSEGMCEPNVVNNVIFGNITDGVRTVGGGSSPYISNNIIMSNGNYGINNSGMSPTVAFNDVYNNTVGDYNDVIVGPGSISVDPEFVDAFGEDFHLLSTSPAIDAGSATNAPPDDIDGDSRPMGDYFDIGVDEFNSKQTSTGFYYPTGTSFFNNTCGTWLGRDPANGGCYFDGYYHIGFDIMADENSPVFPIADGIITHKSVNGWGTGNVGIVIKHKLSGGSEFSALYGHITTNLDVGDEVTGGVEFANIGYYSDGNHLHFGIHPGLTMPSTNWGLMPNSSWPDTNGFVDPINWIENNTPFTIGIDIKANSSDEPIMITYSDILSITISLDPGSHGGDNADWWILVNTLFGLYHYELSDTWKPGLTYTHQGSLFHLPDYNVMNVSGLPPSFYIFYFVIDMNMNGSLDMEDIFYDSVEVTITP